MKTLVAVEGQTLRWYGKIPEIADNSVQFVQLEFDLPEDWSDLVVVAQFSQTKTYNKLLEDGCCYLPAELVAGPCEVSLFGQRAGETVRATSVPLRFKISRSGFTSTAENPIPPTPDLYAQLLEKLGHQGPSESVSVEDDGEGNVSFAPGFEGDGEDHELNSLNTGKTVYTSFPDKVAREGLKGKLANPGGLTPGKLLRVKSVDQDGNILLEGADMPSEGSSVTIDTTLTQPGQAADAKATGDAISKLSQQNLDLGFVNGRLYIMVSGVPVGSGVEIGGAVVPPEQPEPGEGVVVFAADFSGDRPDPAQFYTWEGRVFNGATWDALENIRCVDGVAILTNKYDADKGLWVEQLMTTGGLFESDDFTCKFRAKFSGLPGSWGYFITYGTGTYWTSGMYSDGIKWPAGGEIDAFEQAPTYSENPTAIMHGAHWGSGSNSDYPDTHEWIPDGVAGKTDIDTDEWHDFKFRLKNGVATVWIDGEQVYEFDLSDETVSNNYLVDYHPFLRPHALYMAAQCHSGDSRTDKGNVYVMEISDLEVYQDALVECTGLEIYPQMWARGTELVFPVGAELYLEREYTPANTSNKACAWQSSNPAVATVVQGYVKVIGTGTAVITATCGNATAQYTVTAAEAASIPCVKLVTKGEIGTTVGDTVDIAEQLYLYPKFTTDEIALASDSELVSINGSSVTILGAGSAEVTVTVGNCSAALMLNIASGAPELMMEHDYVENRVVNGNPQSYIQWVAGGTYTLHYQVTENPKYTGTVEFPMSCRMMNDKGSNRAPEVRFVTSGDCEIYVGNAYACHTYTPAPGDWVTIVFTAAGGKTAAVYINGQLVADDFQVYESYLYIGESLRPVEVFERSTVPPYCVGRIEIYRGDDRERHKAG